MSLGRLVASRLRHPVNVEHYDMAPLGVRVADRVTGFMGSWKFIVIQSVIVAIWITGNVVLVFHFDAYPFILLNLAFSTQAAYAAPLILLAGNRSAQRDRATLEHTASQEDFEVERLAKLDAVISDIASTVARIESTLLNIGQ